MAAAVTATRLNASNYHVKYLLTSDGAATLNIDAAGAATPDLLTDTTVNTPIRNLVTAVVADQAAARALMRAATASYSLAGAGALLADWIIDFNANANQLRCTVTCGGADAVGCVLTLGVVHSSIR